MERNFKAPGHHLSVAPGPEALLGRGDDQGSAVDQKNPSSISPETIARTASRCPVPNSTQGKYRGVTISSECDYWAIAIGMHSGNL